MPEEPSAEQPKLGRKAQFANLKSKVKKWLEPSGLDVFSFEQVLHRELAAVEAGRKLRGQRRINPPAGGSNAGKRAYDAELTGLAFSGGGIRSATFNLGVLQALARLNLLSSFDYLSTVSGGGYIGSWLAAWVFRTTGGIREIEKRLGNPAPKPDDPQLRPVALLRDYSNYLTPQLGGLGADAWTMVSIWLRNTLLNLLILVPAGAAVLLTPFVLYLIYHFLIGLGAPQRPLLIAACVVPFIVSGFFVGRNLLWFKSSQQAAFYTVPKWTRRLIVLPTFVSAFFLSALALEHFHPGSQFWSAATRRLCISFGAATAAYLFIIQICAGLFGSFQKNVPSRASAFRKALRGLQAILAFAFYPLIAGSVGASLMLGLEALLVRTGASAWHEWAAMSWGTLLVLITLSVVVTIHVGLMGRNLKDDRREWWGRLSAWFFICSIVFAAVVSIAIWGPELVQGWRRQAAAVISWIGTTAAGVLAGKSAKIGIQKDGEPHLSGKALQILVKVAPVAFATGLLLLLSKFISVVLVELLPNYNCNDCYWMRISAMVDPHARWWLAPVGFVLCAASALLLSCTVDINEFSMHHFYKNRLARCYLGASRTNERNPNPSTGFDEKDDLAMAALDPTRPEQQPNDKPTGEGFEAPYDGPLPIINATLNLVHGEKLAWQERKGTSFFWTPLFSGFECSNDVLPPPNRTDIAPCAYRATQDYAYSPGGIHIGTAVAVSGAAANPNMGYHSSAGAAFLMTVFNVRLGWWLGNPKNNKTWQKAGPTLGLAYLVKELLGLTNDRSRFVNLSDGGHFENLGIYELVRRRCRYIVVCDAEEDHKLAFGGLGNAIRKCRDDFGADIEIDVSQIQHGVGTKLSRSHCAVGKIKYADPRGKEGVLVYLKASLTGDEDQDVTEYAAHHQVFPHQSTADQWFTESQFESYRKLGQHVAEKTFEPACLSSDAFQDKAQFFSVLRDFWWPPSLEVDRDFTRHTASYDALLERIRTNPSLGPRLDPGMFPAMATLSTNPNRDAFYFCASLIQLMENVYLDLRLEENLNHPDNAGWLRVFCNWTSNEDFVNVWQLTRNTYGITFQRWCERNFRLP